MPKKLLKDGKFYEVDYELLDTNSFSQKMLVPFSEWQSSSVKAEEIGVLIPPDVDLQELADIKPGFDWLAVEFKAFADGRGFSLGSVIRASLAYEGDIRACGDIIPDQIASLIRSGFTSFELNSEVNEQGLVDIVESFSEAYQTSQNQPLPLYRRVER